MRRDTITLRDRFRAMRDFTDMVQQEFEQYITSPAHSLELRWQMFLDAPEVLSKHQKDIYHGLDWIKTGEEDYDTWLRTIDYDKGEIIDLVGLVDDIKSGAIRERLGDQPFLDEEGFLDKVKEQLLKDNIKSFHHNW